MDLINDLLPAQRVVIELPKCPAEKADRRRSGDHHMSRLAVPIKPRPIGGRVAGGVRETTLTAPDPGLFTNGYWFLPGKIPAFFRCDLPDDSGKGTDMSDKKGPAKKPATKPGETAKSIGEKKPNGKLSRGKK
ncbi:MAG: hypothetical protein LBI67_05595 [Treponema sp.]|jgi:hypothetical protein|nr:hypothetical protein [Treponema sp.]